MSTEIKITKNRQAWRRGGWTATPNALLLDAEIDWEAKGAFGWLSLAADDDEFEVTAVSLAAAGPKGRDHAQKMVRTLEQHGWVTRNRVPDAGTGRPVLVYELQPTPVAEDERTWRPSTARARRGALSQVKPQSLHVQALGSDDESLNVQALGADQAKHVSAGRAPKPARVGPTRAGCLTTSLERQQHACMHEGLWSELTTAAGAQVDQAGRRAVESVLTTALDDGWTPTTLVQHVRDVMARKPRILNRGGFLVSLLRDLPKPPQPTRPVHEVWPDGSVSELPPACAACLTESPRAATSIKFRTARDSDRGELLRDDEGRVVPCPTCHPAALTSEPVSV
jgi:hypothetical protein